MTTTVEKKLNALFEELVPASGKADTVAGEIVRAITHIGYRNYNDGDHIGVGYGKETCNPAARYLSAKCGEAVNAAIDAIWGDAYDERYDKGLAALEQAVLDWLEEHPELRTEENTEDTWSYRDPEEDTDDENEEDDW